MKNKDIIELNSALNSINLKGPNFAYGIAKNINILKPEIEALDNARKPSEDFLKYDSERVELAKKHAEKDEKGRPIMESNSYKIVDDVAFELELSELKEKHKVALDNREEQLEEFKKLLDKEVPVNLFKIELQDIPEDITSKQMTSIFCIIKE